MSCKALTQICIGIFRVLVSRTQTRRAEEVALDLAEAIAERMANNGIWIAPSGSEGLYVASIRALVRQASMRPAMAKRSVFVVGDAERMVAQEGADQAANAFLKLLEEPSPHTTIIMTTSEPGSILPTIRSRVVSFRISDVAAADMRTFLRNEIVRKHVDHAGAGARTSSGSPGKLLSHGLSSTAFGAAEELLSLALRERSPETLAASALLTARFGVSGARGEFSDMLDALVVVMHERVQQVVQETTQTDNGAGAEHEAFNASRAMLIIEAAKQQSRGNVSPQLVGAELLRQLNLTMRRRST